MKLVPFTIPPPTINIVIAHCSILQLKPTPINLQTLMKLLGPGVRQNTDQIIFTLSLPSLRRRGQDGRNNVDLAGSRKSCQAGFVFFVYT